MPTGPTHCHEIVAKMLPASVHDPVHLLGFCGIVFTLTGSQVGHVWVVANAPLFLCVQMPIPHAEMTRGFIDPPQGWRGRKWQRNLAVDNRIVNLKKALLRTFLVAYNLDRSKNPPKAWAFTPDLIFNEESCQRKAGSKNHDLLASNASNIKRHLYIRQWLLLVTSTTTQCRGGPDPCRPSPSTGHL